MSPMLNLSSLTPVSNDSTSEFQDSVIPSYFEILTLDCEKSQLEEFPSYPRFLLTEPA